MAAFIPALLGLGSSIAGGISGAVKRRKARSEIEGAPLQSRAIAEENARNIQRQAIGQRTTNPMAALRSASQLGLQERQAGNVAAAREQTVKNQLLAQLRQNEAVQLQLVLGQLGTAGGAVSAQLLGSEPMAAEATAGLSPEQQLLQQIEGQSAVENIAPAAPVDPAQLGIQPQAQGQTVLPDLNDIQFSEQEIGAVNDPDDAMLRRLLAQRRRGF